VLSPLSVPLPALACASAALRTLPLLLPTLLVARVVAVVVVCRYVRACRTIALRCASVCFAFWSRLVWGFWSCVVGVAGHTFASYASYLLNVDGINAKNGSYCLVFNISCPKYKTSVRWILSFFQVVDERTNVGLLDLFARS
jgi:hypothetical protein